jgi:hypothetical protein
MTNIYAWHFIKEDGTAHGGYVPPSDKQEKFSGEIQLCNSGLHASERIIDALQYANGSILRRVVCSGEVVRGADKLVCTQRKELWRIDATVILHEFACWTVEQAISLIDNPDPRSVAAIQAKRDWLAGKITDIELDAARDAAWAAARDAALADARDAALADAARSAAWAAARSAVWAAARSDQNKHLHRLAIAEHRRLGR